MRIRVYGYMCIRVYGYMDIWIYGYMDICVYVYMCICVHLNKRIFTLLAYLYFFTRYIKKRNAKCIPPSVKISPNRLFSSPSL